MKEDLTSASISKAAARFWSRVDQLDGPNECWLWTGTIQPNGYGRTYFDWRPVQAHRLAYELAKGPIPEGLCVLHSCNNRACVNPAHLRLGTRVDNTRQRETDGRGVHGERHYRHKLTEVQVLEIRGRYATGEWSQIELAREFGASSCSIADVVHGRTWKHLLGKESDG